MKSPRHRPFFKKKRYIFPLIFLLLVGIAITPFIINPLKSFRTSTTFLLNLFGVQERIVRHGKYRIHVYEGGQDQEQTVILLHGFGGNALLTWMQLMPFLVRDFHVVAPDLLASNFLALSPSRYSIDSEKKVVLAMMDGLGIQQADFVGLSVGGWVSLLIALEHPERVRRMVLVESAGITTEVPELAKLTLDDRDKAKRFMKMLFYWPPPLPDFVLDQLVKTSRRIKPRYEAVFAGFIENSRDRVLDDHLGEILHPILMMHGRQDQVIPLAVGQKIHEGLPNSEFI
ncbi:MAG: alpha/beta fold hydrolase, partial [bacterium]|nr:alpha/beta fold hydrolase [bacterium]